MSANALTYSESQNIMTVIRFNVVADKLYRGNPKRKYRHEMGLSVEALAQLFERLNRHNVRYLLVDGMACVVHGHIRTNAVVSIWLENSIENNQAFASAVNEYINSGFLAPEGLLPSAGFSMRYGKPGFELDVKYSLNAFSEQDFHQCYTRAFILEFEKEPFFVINLQDLIFDKMASTAYNDSADLEELRRIWEEQNRS